MKIEPVTLVGQTVRLEPLSMSHLAGLCVVGLDDELWRWIPTPVRSETEMRQYIETALEGQRQSAMLPFATIESAGGRIVGSTRYYSIDAKNRRLEIGGTWIARVAAHGG